MDWLDQLRGWLALLSLDSSLGIEHVGVEELIRGTKGTSRPRWYESHFGWQNLGKTREAMSMQTEKLANALRAVGD